MTTADDKVTPFPTPLEQIGRRIDAAWKRLQVSDQEFIDGSLEAGQALRTGREHFPADKAFGAWLKENNHDHFNAHDRAALIGLAGDLKLAREVLMQTDSRSYELIWKNNKERFASTRNPDQPKRGRPSGRRAKSHKPRPPEHHAAAAKALDEGKTREQVAAETGLSQHQVQLSREREMGRREAFAELLDAAGAQHFTEKGALRIEDAIRIHTARLNKQFAQRLGEEVRKGIAAANDAMRANYARLSADNLNLTRIVGQRGVFTEKQFKQMLMLCHPDSSAGPELKAELLCLLIENKSRLIKPERG